MANIELALRRPYEKKQFFWDILIITAILSVLCLMLVNPLRSEVFHPLIKSFDNHAWLSFLIKPSLLWMTMGLTLLTIRTILWINYRPTPDVNFDDAPKITVIIPAYNEGAMVRKSIDSCANAIYPRDRMEIIVIDDGSIDDTWLHIERSVREHAGLVRAVQFPKNRGKREALAAGFRTAAGQIVVTVDSDSEIEPRTLLALAGPFRDQRVGAVAGKVCVLNRFKSLLPRMLHVQFIISFDFLRSAQSTYGTVYCCPGALSAYRLSLVRRCLDKWVNQQFLGASCNTGEDRALTNNILDLGYKTVYQGTAVVHTLAPETYKKLCKMFLRWDRSYIREEIRLLKIMWKLPLSSLFLTFIEKVTTNLRFPVAYFTMTLMIMMCIHDPFTIIRFLIAIGLTSTFFMLYFLRSERSKEFIYGILFSYFSCFALFWIFPYALFTLKNRSWMTR